MTRRNQHGGALFTRPQGFTLVELLVVIAIIGILVALLLPAIQSARESGRRTQCKNNVRNLALAAYQHASTHNHFPTGGWGYAWMPDPDRGLGIRQPGGWQYGILPFIEENTLYAMGKGASPTEKRKAGAERVATVIPGFYCPTRRIPDTYPNIAAFHNIDKPALIARSDYAANAGSNIYWGAAGPTAASINATDAEIDAQIPVQALTQNGIVFARSTVRIPHVHDGLAKTYLLGERHIPFKVYVEGGGIDDDQGWGVGWDQDAIRTTSMAPNFDQSVGINSWFFGSAHPSSVNMAMCDGSVHSVSYEISQAAHMILGSRADGQTIDGAAFGN